MIIADLNYLEMAVETSELQGGLLNKRSKQYNVSYISQSAVASAGNGGGVNIGNIALAINIANVIQGNF